MKLKDAPEWTHIALARSIERGDNWTPITKHGLAHWDNRTDEYAHYPLIKVKDVYYVLMAAAAVPKRVK